MRLPVSRLPFPVALTVALAATACSSSNAVTSSDSGPHDAAVKDTAPADTGHALDSGVDSGHDAGHDAHVAKADTGVDAGSGGGDAASESGPTGDAGGPTEAGKAPPPSGDASASTASTIFALHHLWLGDSLPDPSFMPDTAGTAWASFGYNIDGLLTTEASTDVCTLDTAAGATPAKQVDGVNGIDNSFGKNIVPLLASALPNLSQTVSASIASGAFNVILGTVGLTKSPTQTNTGLKGAIFNGAPFGGTPPLNDAGFFKTTDEWPIYGDSLKGSLEAGAVEEFSSAYVTNGVWVNGSPGDITLELLLQGQPLVLQIHQAQVSFTHTVDAAGQDHATNGYISGVLKTSELLQEINIVAAQQDYCAEAGLLLGVMAASSDILHDGTNVKGKACDGISIGLAFDADGVAAPATVVPSVDAGPAPKGCVADAG
jgi:hypothetical protein